MSNFKHSFFRTLLYAQLLSGFSGVAIAAQISLSVKDRPMREVIKEFKAIKTTINQLLTRV